MQVGNKYLIPLTRRKRIFTRPTTRIWYIDSFGREIFDYMSFPKIKREEGQPDKIVATIHAIHREYIELKLDNTRIITVHPEFIETLEKL